MLDLNICGIKKGRGRTCHMNGLWHRGEYHNLRQKPWNTLENFAPFRSPLPFAILLYPRNFAITPQHYRGKGACIGVSRIFGEDSRTNGLKQCPISNGRCCSRIKMLFTVSLGKLLAKLKAVPFQPVYSRIGRTRKNGGPERGTGKKRKVPSSSWRIIFFLVRFARFTRSQYHSWQFLAV